MSQFDPGVDRARQLLRQANALAPDGDGFWLLAVAIGVAIAEHAWPQELQGKAVIPVFDTISCACLKHWCDLHEIVPGMQVGHA
jgi:hypothetical protein